MKVLHITNAYPTKNYSSFGIFIKEQIQSLISKNVTCDTLFINANENGKFAYLSSYFNIKKIYKNYDIIHCHHKYSAFLTILTGAHKHKPVLTSFLSSIEGETEGAFNSYIFKTVLKNAKAFINKSDPDINNKFPGKGFYLPNGVNTDLFKPLNSDECKRKLGIDDGMYLLFTASGSINRPEKRYDLFKKTLEILNQKYHYNVKELLMSGVERELTPLYFNSSKLHLLTSDYEGSPNSVKESLACNIPVVSTNVGNVKDILSSIDGCYVSKSNNPSELAELCNKVLKSKQVDGVQGILKQKLDIESVANRLIEIYTLLLQKEL